MHVEAPSRWYFEELDGQDFAVGSNKEKIVRSGKGRGNRG